MKLFLFPVRAPIPVLAIASIMCGVVCIMPTSATADFIKARLEPTEAGDDLLTWRLFAEFTSPADRVLGVSAQDGHPIVFRSTSPLFNDGGDFEGLMLEDLAQAPISGPRDSWVTIGVDESAGNDTILSTGFGGGDDVHAVITGSAWCENEGGWFDSNPNSPIHPDEGRVLLAQFTVPRDATVTMSGVLIWSAPGGGPQSDPFLVWNGSPPQLCLGDIDGDGLIGFVELLAVLAAWGPCNCCPEDIDANGNVGFEDLLFVLSAWGDCFP